MGRAIEYFGGVVWRERCEGDILSGLEGTAGREGASWEYNLGWDGEVASCWELELEGL